MFFIYVKISGAFNHTVLDARRLYLRQPASQTDICGSRTGAGSGAITGIRRRFPSRGPERPVDDPDLHCNLHRAYRLSQIAWRFRKAETVTRSGV